MPSHDMVAELIHAYSGNKNLAEIADAASINYQRLRNIVAGRVKEVSDKEIDSIAKALGVIATKDELPRIIKMPMVKVPVVGAASAGPGAYIHPDQYSVYVPSSMVIHDSRAWEAEGDSMMPWIQPGDVIIARPHKTPRLGYPMLVRNSDGETMVKIIAHEGGQFVLRSLNAAYPDIPAQVEYIGYVTGRFRSVAGYELIESEPAGLRPPTQ